MKQQPSRRASRIRSSSDCLHNKRTDFSRFFLCAGSFFVETESLSTFRETGGRIASHLLMSRRKEKIAVLVSGGVDSSVALALLKNAGHDVRAFYLKIWLEDEVSFLGECPWEEDLRYVRAVCAKLDVPLSVVPLQKEYWTRVVSYVLDEVRLGRTPNPDMLCNPRVKFGAFYDAFGKGFDRIATGHYAQTVSRRGKTKLLCSPDPVKDQTYFLAGLTQEQLYAITILQDFTDRRTTKTKLEQVVRVGVAVGRHLQGQSLVHRAAGESVELGPFRVHAIRVDVTEVQEAP